MTWPFEPLIPMSYELIVADPPWPFDLYSSKGNRKSAAQHYRLMTLAEIKALPVVQLAQRDCLLLMWATAPQLKAALDTMHAWGFDYKTNLVWRKTTPKGKVRMGTGYWARTMHEQVLVGTRGTPTKVVAFPSLFDGVAREHSRKPDEFFHWVDRCTYCCRRLDLFSRASRPGWDTWGDQQGHFDDLDRDRMLEDSARRFSGAMRNLAAR